jgi:tetratricopeptide (TPR) repeat protein
MSSHSNFPAKLRGSDMCLRNASPFIALAAVALLCAFSAIAQPQGAHSGPPQASGTSQSAAGFASLSQRAMDALDADHLQEAIPLFRKALVLNPRWAEGWWSLGTAYYDEELYAEAQTAFKRVVALDQKNGTARAFLGLCEFELGDEKASLRDIEASKDLGTDIDPQLRKVVFYHEGILLQRAGQFVAAEKPFAWLCLSSPGSAEVVRGFGMAALRMRDRQFPAPGSEAATVTEEVGHAACTAAQKNFDSAREQLTAVVAAHPHFPYLHYAFGRVLLDASDTPGAIAEFKLEIDEGHDRLLPLLQIAACEYKVDPGSGLPYAQQAVALAPKSAFAHFVLGLLLENTGEEEKAIPELEIARGAFPKDQKVYWALATAYARTGRAQDAAKARAEVARLHRNAEQDGVGTNADSSQDAPVNVTDAAEQGPRN